MIFSREEANGLDGCLKIIFWLVIQVKRTFLSIILMISIPQLPSFERISIAFILVVISESHQWYCICNMKTVVWINVHLFSVFCLRRIA